MPQLRGSQYPSPVPLTMADTCATRSPTTDSSASGTTKPTSICSTSLQDRAVPWTGQTLRIPSRSTTGAPIPVGSYSVPDATTAFIRAPISVTLMLTALPPRPLCCRSAIRAVSIATVSCRLTCLTSSPAPLASIAIRPAEPSKTSRARILACAHKSCLSVS